MATEVPVTFSSGSVGNKSAVSCVGVAVQGSVGVTRTYFGVTGSGVFRQNDDGTIDFKVDSVYLEQTNVYNNGYPDSPFWFNGIRVKKSSFTISDGPGGPSVDGDLISTTGSMHHTGNPGTCSGSYSGTGYARVANNVYELGSDSSDFGIWIAGLIDYGTTPDYDISIPALKISFQSAGSPGIEALFEYFPWERRINSVWYSLNREGGKSTTAGLFRMAGGAWSPLTNRQSGEPNHGFRYNNGWQRSPKSGQGA